MTGFMMRKLLLSMAMLLALASARTPAAENYNVALFGKPYSNRPMWSGANIAGLTDGNTINTFHLDQTIETGAAYTIDLGESFNVQSLKIYPRQDGCCPERLINFRVSIHNDVDGQPGPELWGQTMYDDGTNPGAERGTVVDVVLTAPQTGRWIQILSLDDPPPAYALQMTEVEVFAPVDAPRLKITAPPQSTAAGVGRTVNFTVGAGVLAGDPTLITYQWQKNGQDIAGANAASYTTPPVFQSDDKAVFRCVVGYPGLASQTSAEATLRVNIAFESKTYSNRPLWTGAPAWTIGMIVDGNRAAALHGDTAIEPGMAYDIDLGASFKLEEIDIFPRQDGCCPERLANFRVSVHKNDNGGPGDSVWQADFFTAEGENAGAQPGTVLKINAALNPGGTFEGQWIRILSLADPVPDYFLQMTEVEAYGQPTAGAPLLQITRSPASALTSPGHAVTFSVGARVLNGDAALIRYQWFRNGTAIPGATSDTYTTPPLPLDGTNGVYRVVVSYPGTGDLTSEEASIAFDYNYARLQPATTSAPLWGPGGWNISAIVDGNRTTVIHGDTTPPLGFKYEIDLGLDVDVERIDIYPRQDGCCPERLANFRVSLHADSGGQPGAEQWHLDMFTGEGENAGSGAEMLVTIAKGEGTGTFSGRWFRIQALSDPVPDYFLQLTEIEVYGLAKSIPQPRPTLSYAVANGQLVLTYEGTLETATDVVNGPWVTVAGPSPYPVNLDLGKVFFRAVRR